MNNSRTKDIEQVTDRMKILEVENKEFENIFKSPYHCFNKADFNEHNKYKCDWLYYWLFKSAKIRLGFICGLNDGILSSPFSAPFGGLSFLDENIKIQHIEESVDALIDKCTEEGFQLYITLPPLFYNEIFVSKSINCLYRKDFEIDSIDLNTFYKLEDFNENYMDTISNNARANLRKSLLFDLNFYRCRSDAEKSEAYEIIKTHHDSKGYPLRMSWQQVYSTSSIIPADYFILRDSDGTGIASAIVFHVAEEICQIIYWGSLQEYNQYRPMNYLSYKIFEYYKNINYRYIDLGRSSDNSIPNYGLCKFKEDIGCSITPKFSFRYKPAKGLSKQIIEQAVTFS